MVVFCMHYKLSIYWRHKDDWTNLVGWSACTNHHYQRWTTLKLNLMHWEQYCTWENIFTGYTQKLLKYRNEPASKYPGNNGEEKKFSEPLLRFRWQSLKLLMNATTVCKCQWMRRGEKEVVGTRLQWHSFTDRTEKKIIYLQLPCVQQFVLLYNCHKIFNKCFNFFISSAWYLLD